MAKRQQLTSYEIISRFDWLRTAWNDVDAVIRSHLESMPKGTRPIIYERYTPLEVVGALGCEASIKIKSTDVRALAWSVVPSDPSIRILYRRLIYRTTIGNVLRAEMISAHVDLVRPADALTPTFSVAITQAGKKLRKSFQNILGDRVKRQPKKINPEDFGRILPLLVQKLVETD